MIEYSWRTRPDRRERDEIVAMVKRAAVYDDEPEFTIIDPTAAAAELSELHSRTHYLAVFVRPSGQVDGRPVGERRVAGVLRLVTTADGKGDAYFVVDPELRSQGITTQFVEEAGLDPNAAGGWLGSGVSRISAWAHTVIIPRQTVSRTVSIFRCPSVYGR